MGERTQYTPGTFCWTDLSTTDQDAAKAFYSGLFGWEADDMPVGDGFVYSMMKMGGRDAAAISLQQPQQREAGVPPLWNSYVSVQSADATAERAVEAGGSVHGAAFDVLEAGRMAVIQDPHGAFFIAWEPRAHFGAGLVNAPGALSWNELASPDPAAAGAFYADLFGWTLSSHETPDGPYMTVKNGETNNGGIRELQPPGVPPHWLVYFGTDDIDAGLAKVEELGGTRMVGPIDVGMAKIGVVQDPQGAVFALYAGDLEP